MALLPFDIIERGSGRFSVFGELDMATAPQVRKLDHHHGPLVLDLRGVSFIDSTGLGALLHLQHRCEHDGCSFAIEAASASVEQVVQLAGVGDLLLGASANGSALSDDDERILATVRQLGPCRTAGLLKAIRVLPSGTYPTASILNAALERLAAQGWLRLTIVDRDYQGGAIKPAASFYVYAESEFEHPPARAEAV